MKRLRLTLFILVTVLPSFLSAQSPERLAQLLKQYPEADSNGDGKLTIEEAQNYRQILKGKRSPKKGKGSGNAATKPTHADVSYGPHQLNKMDLWLAKSDKPTPLLIFVHGGGFKGGDKSQFKSNSNTIREYNNAGISLASINYRLTDGGKYPFPTAMNDIARAIQFLRYNAKKYNLDKTRFGSHGGSAGGCITLWLGFHPDMAKPDSKDPIERESTRLQALGGSGAQSCLHLPTLKEWFKVKSLQPHPAFRPFFGIPAEGEIVWNGELDKKMRDASPITYLTADDPPAYLNYQKPVKITENSSPGTWVHHATMGLTLKEKMDELGIECYVNTQQNNGSIKYKSLVEFMIDKLTAAKESQ